jgi:hypothetical protein
MGHSHRLAQGRVVEIVLREAQPVQAGFALLLL